MQDETTRKQMSSDMPRKDFREVATIASGTQGDSLLSTIVINLLRLLLLLVLVPSLLSFHQDINRIPFSDGEQIGVGAVTTSCYGIKDLIALGLCHPHQLSMTPGGVLELHSVEATDADADAAPVWSSAATQKKKKNKQSQTYVAKRTGAAISIFETKKKQNVVWEGTLEEHPALAAHL